MSTVHLPIHATRSIIADVAQRSGVEPSDLVGAQRHRRFVIPRHAAYAEVRARRHLSLPKIGQTFGGRHHTTILDGLRKHEARMAWVEVIKACVPPADGGEA